MFVQKALVLVPPVRPVPPRAAILADVFAWLFEASDAAGTRLVARLEATRSRHAIERELRREARSRAQVVALAQRYESTQPEFAKDLYAAARSDRGRIPVVD
jgi:hypothetical protein